MTEIMSDAGWLVGMAFIVNIIVQITKGFIPIPTKLWCIIVSVSVMSLALLSTKTYHDVCVSDIFSSFVGSLVVAYVAMYGFDTLKELWQRFRKGENINEDK